MNLSKLKKGTTFILALALTGCGAQIVREPPQIVNVAVPVKCEPTLKVTDINDYPTDHFTKDMPLYDKTKLALAELALLRGQNKELKAALTECTKVPETKKTAP